MTLIYRRDDPPPSDTRVIVRFGAGIKAVDQLIINSIENYHSYNHIAAALGWPEPGALTLSVYAPHEIEDFLDSRRDTYRQYGHVSVKTLRESGYRLWPTTPLDTNGTPTRFGDQHFDIPLSRPADLIIPVALTDSNRSQRKLLREQLRPQFEDLLGLFTQLRLDSDNPNGAVQ